MLVDGISRQSIPPSTAPEGRDPAVTLMEPWDRVESVTLTWIKANKVPMANLTLVRSPWPGGMTEAAACCRNVPTGRATIVAEPSAAQGAPGERPMAYKDLLVVLDKDARSQARIAVAASLAERFGAHGHRPVR
jgi:hypothetical protein